MSLAAGVLSAALALPQTGLIAAYDFARTNHLNRSEDLTQATWNLTGAWATGTTRTLSGGVSIITVTGTGDGFIWAGINLTGNTTGLRVFMRARVRGSGSVRLNLADTGGAVSANDLATSSLITLTDQWQDLYATGVITVADRTGIQFRLRGAGPLRLEVERAQGGYGADAPYEKTTDGQLLLDRSVRLWPAPAARTNLLNWSEDVSQAATWSRSGLSSVGADGLMTDDTSGAVHGINQVIPIAVPDGSTVTFTADLIAGTNRYVILRIKDRAGVTTSIRSAFDIQAGAIMSTSGGTASITPLGGGVYRCAVSGSVGAGSLLPEAGIYFSLNAQEAAASNANYVGTGTGTTTVKRAWVNRSDALPYEKQTDGVTYDLSLKGRNLLPSSEGYGLMTDAYFTAARSGVMPSTVTITVNNTSGAALGTSRQWFGQSGTNSQGGSTVSLQPGRTYVLSAALQVTGSLGGGTLHLGMHVFKNGSYTNEPGTFIPAPSSGHFSMGYTVPADGGTYTCAPRIVIYSVGNGGTGSLTISEVQLEEVLVGYQPTTYQRSPSHGTLGSSSSADSNDPAWTPQGLSFDGVDDFVPVNIPEFTGEMTLIVVARGSSNFVLARMNYASNDNTPGGMDKGWGASFTADGLLQLVWNMAPSPTGAQYLSAQGVPGRHNCFAYTYRAGRLASFAGGALKQEILAPQPSAATGKQAYLGRRAPGGYFAGSVAYVAVYNRALTDAEVHQAYRFIRNQLSRRGVTI